MMIIDSGMLWRQFGAAIDHCLGDGGGVDEQCLGVVRQCDHCLRVADKFFDFGVVLQRRAGPIVLGRDDVE